MQVLYQGFFEYLEGNFITQEEVLDVLGRVADKSRKLKDSVLVLDGYTGFTPIQIQLLEKLLEISSQIYVTVTMGRGEDPYHPGSLHQLFCLSKQTVARLCKLAVGTGKRGAVSREIYKKSADGFSGTESFPLSQRNV